MDRLSSTLPGIVAALLVLFSALIDPRLSAALAVLLLGVFILFLRDERPPRARERDAHDETHHTRP